MLKTDPQDLKLADGDISITTDLEFVSGVAGIAQSIDLAINTFVGEWFANLDAGVDWYGTILGKGFNEPAIRAELRRAILSVDGVSTISKLETSLDNATRTLTVTWAVVAEFDETVTGETGVSI